MYISENAHPETISHIRNMGYSIELIGRMGSVHPAIASHPDVFFCRMGACDDAEVVTGQSPARRSVPSIDGSSNDSGIVTEHRPVSEVDSGVDRLNSIVNTVVGQQILQEEVHREMILYPDDSKYNAACTGKYLIHRLDITAPEIREYADRHGMVAIDVPQGYAKCSTVIVSEDAIITYDRGIARACEKAAANLDVLLIEPGHVDLPGMPSKEPVSMTCDRSVTENMKGKDQGFLGGASGRVYDEIIFNGDLSRHPDFLSVKGFIEDRGLKCVWVPGKPLVDIGSIV